MRRLLLAVPLALLLAAPAAYGGDFATVGLSSSPEGIDPGEPWSVNLTVLQHGRTPLTGITPTVEIRSGDSVKTFAAEPTGKPGVYHAEVVFPAAGNWKYTVYDGFADITRHTFPAVDIGGGSAAAPPPARTNPAPADDGPLTGWLIAGVLLLVAAALVVVWDRRRPAPRREPEPA